MPTRKWGREKLVNTSTAGVQIASKVAALAGGGYVVVWEDLDGTTDVRRFETWERNVAALLGVGAAVDSALAWGLADIAARIEKLADDLREQLAEIPGVTVRDLGRATSRACVPSARKPR